MITHNKQNFLSTTKTKTKENVNKDDKFLSTTAPVPSDEDNFGFKLLPHGDIESEQKD